MTNTVAAIIQATSPLSGTGAGVAAGAAESIAGSPGGKAGSSANANPVKPSDMDKTKTVRIFFMRLYSLKRLCPGLAGADTNHLFEVEHENLAVADFSG